MLYNYSKFYCILFIEDPKCTQNGASQVGAKVCTYSEKKDTLVSIDDFVPVRLKIFLFEE